MPCFTPSSSVSGAGGPIVVFDVNDDGLLDIVVGDGPGTLGLSVCLGDGSGVVDSACFVESIADVPSRLVSGDLNDDGRVDLAFVSGNGVFAALGDGDGNFAAQQLRAPPPPMGIPPRAFVLARLNAARPPVVLVENGDRFDRNVSTVEAYACESGGVTFSSTTLLSVGSADTWNTLGVADADGDGDDDVFEKEDSVVFLRTSSPEGLSGRTVVGFFSFPDPISTDVLAFDRDDDGIAELVDPESCGEGVAGTFVLGDVDGDGSTDAVIAGDCLLTRGFAFHLADLGGRGFANAGIGDLDADGRADLVVTGPDLAVLRAGGD